MTDFDIIIVGAGPAGISAAHPLVAAGLKVAMVDGGHDRELADIGVAPLLERRFGDAGQWRCFLGEDYGALKNQPVASPKFRVPGVQRMFSDFQKAYAVETEGFRAVGALAAGGLSTVWGAGVACYGDDELRGTVLAASDLAESLGHVADRIGVSGDLDDLGDFFGSDVALQPPLRLASNARLLYERYRKAPAAALKRGVRIGRARNAVLTRPHGGRGACTECGWCLWGCPERSIYNAAFDLQRLVAAANFKLLPDTVAEGVESRPCCVDVRLRKATGERTTLRGGKVLLACGAIGSAKLVLSALQRFDTPVRLLSNPTAGCAIWLPERFGAGIDGRSFSLAQLSFVARPADAPYAFGNLFATDGLPRHEFLRLAPISMGAAARLFPAILPSMLVANVFFSSEYSNHQLSIGGDHRVRIRGRFVASIGEAADQVRHMLSRTLLRYRALVVPGGFQLGEPGTDIHYAGTIPMRAMPNPHESGPDGEVAGLAGVHVVDASALPVLTAKPHTLTVMANADRVARRIASAWATRRLAKTS